MQVMRTVVGGQVQELMLPSPSSSIGETVWGAFDALFTPAFWRGQVWQHQMMGTYTDNQLGGDLREELAACLLGGYGMPAAMGLAAFRRVRDLGLLRGAADEAQLLRALEEPFVIAGRAKRYRFPRQKARYLAQALGASDAIDPQLDDRAFRDALTRLPGVGLKTASWVVRNVRASDMIAILDVHIVRACRLARVFPPTLTPERQYHALEDRFLAFAAAIGAPASTLDALMWDYMRRLPPGFTCGLEADDGHPNRTYVAARLKGPNDFTAKQPKRAKA